MHLTSGRVALLAGTAGALGVTARSVLGPPLPMGVVLGAFGVYAAVVMTGVFDPRVAMYVDFLNRLPPSPSKPRIALTFDDGPDPLATPRILDVLDAFDAKATFFVIGHKLTDPARRAIARDAHARGHAVGHHSQSHPRSFALLSARAVRAEVEGGQRALEDALGERCPLFRPPIGHSNPTVARVVAELSLRAIGWSVKARDGLARAARIDVVERVCDGMSDGAIVLMHDGAERDDRAPVAAEAIGEIARAAKEDGFSMVRVDADALPPPAGAMP